MGQLLNFGEALRKPVITHCLNILNKRFSALRWESSYGSALEQDFHWEARNLRWPAWKRAAGRGMDLAGLAYDRAETGRYRAIGLLLLTAVLWSTSGVLIRLVHWPALAIAGGRSGIAALVILAVLRRPRITWSKTQIGAAFLYAAMVTFFVAANKLTSAANAILLEYTAPIYVAILGAWLLKERATWLDWLTILFVLGGIALFFLDQLSPGMLWGNVLALLSGLAFAGFVLIMRGQKDGSPMELAFLGNALTFLIGVPFMLGKGLNSTGLAVLLILGVFQLGIPYILYSLAIKHVTALEAVLIPIIEPLLNPVWVFLAMGETPGRWAATGGIAVLGALAGRQILEARGTKSIVRRRNAEITGR